MNKIAGKNFAVRTLSGAILLLLVLGSVLLSKFTFLAFILVLCTGCLWEFYRISGASGISPQRVYGIVAGVLLISAFFVYSGGWLGAKAGPLLAVIGAALLFIPFISELYRKKSAPLSDIGATLTGIIYIAVPLSLLVLLSMYSGQYRPWFVLAYIFIVWCNDIGAYVVGVTLGKHKLFERISPKKSWEGFFGGIIFAVGAGIVSAVLLKESIWFWAGLSFVAALGGVMGDLVESMMKRAADMKDSGRIMPGHGGFLDRFDALILSVPAVFIYFAIFAI